MRFYNIQISGAAASGQTASNTSGSAPTSTGTTPTPAPAPTQANTFYEPGLRVWDPNTNSNVITVNKAAPTPTTPTPTPTASSSGMSWTSVVNGANDPGALDIEFDIQYPNDQQTPSWIKIKGITPQTISQSNNLNNKNLKMWAGFTNGLPLANLQVPHQGLIMDGNIFPAYGNWIYNELSLDLFVIPTETDGLGGPTKPKNIVHNMPAGTPLSSALTTTLQTAFPNSQIIMNISSALKLNYPDWGVYQSLEQLGNYVKALSHSILGTPPQYKGVSITSKGNTITVDDGTKQGSAIAIAFSDLVGQPTWIGSNEIQVTTCLRGDINPYTSLITLPQTNVTQTMGGAVAQMTSSVGSANYLNFTGTWQVKGLRHIGKFRSTSMDAWITIIKAVTSGSGASNSTTASTDQPNGAPNVSGEHTFNPPSGGASGSTGGIGAA